MRTSILMTGTLALTLACAAHTGARAQDGAAAPAAATATATTDAPAASGYTPRNAAGQVEVVLKNHVFVPAEIRIPPNTPIQLLVRNEDATADEFDSTALRVEKVIGGGSQGVVRLRGLAPGRYPFMGEFHASTAQGVVIVE